MKKRFFIGSWKSWESRNRIGGAGLNKEGIGRERSSEFGILFVRTRKKKQREAEIWAAAMENKTLTKRGI